MKKANAVSKAPELSAKPKPIVKKPQMVTMEYLESPEIRNDKGEVIVPAVYSSWKGHLKYSELLECPVLVTTEHDYTGTRNKKVDNGVVYFVVTKGKDRRLARQGKYCVTDLAVLQLTDNFPAIPSSTPKKKAAKSELEETSTEDLK